VLEHISNKLKFRKARRKKKVKSNKIKLSCCGGAYGTCCIIVTGE
jgi:hypothetical protein